MAKKQRLQNATKTYIITSPSTSLDNKTNFSPMYLSRTKLKPPIKKLFYTTFTLEALDKLSTKLHSNHFGTSDLKLKEDVLISEAASSWEAIAPSFFTTCAKLALPLFIVATPETCCTFWFQVF